VCLTLANAASVLDHVNCVRPARSFTRTLHHAGHLSPGDMWRALDGEYPHTAILVRRHHDVVTVTDQYGDTFAYPTAATIPTAVPDALESGRRAADRATPGSLRLDGTAKRDRSHSFKSQGRNTSDETGLCRIDGLPGVR